MSEPNLSALDALITKLRRSRDLIVRAAPAVAESVADELRATAGAGTTPNGKAWAPRKKDGGRALANAASGINVRAVGTTIQVKLEFPYSLHSIGKGHAKKREIMTVESLVDAMKKVGLPRLVEFWEAS